MLAENRLADENACPPEDVAGGREYVNSSRRSPTRSTMSTSSTRYGLAAADVWGRLRVANAENPLDKQIAATAHMHDLWVVTRNTAHYGPTGVRLLNPFA
jgi:hypothetical protein